MNFAIILKLLAIFFGGIYILYRVFTWKRKYKNYTEYLSKKRMLFGIEHFYYFLIKEKESLLFQITRRKNLGQDLDPVLDSALIILQEKIDEVEKNSSTKDTSSLIVFALWKIRNLIGF